MQQMGTKFAFCCILDIRFTLWFLASNQKPSTFQRQLLIHLGEAAQNRSMGQRKLSNTGRRLGGSLPLKRHLELLLLSLQYTKKVK